MPPKDDRSRGVSPDQGERSHQAGPVGRRRCGRRRPERSLLPESKVAAQHPCAYDTESIGYRPEKDSVGVTARAVCQHQSAARGLFRPVQESNHIALIDPRDRALSHYNYNIGA